MCPNVSADDRQTQLAVFGLYALVTAPNDVAVKFNILRFIGYLQSSCRPTARFFAGWSGENFGFFLKWHVLVQANIAAILRVIVFGISDRQFSTGTCRPKGVHIDRRIRNIFRTGRVVCLKWVG